MSPRAKLTILTVFLVLLGIPGIYFALAWNPPSPFEFRYVGQGAPVKHIFDPLFPEETLCAPLQFEVRNTRPYPIQLWEMRIIGDIVPLPASSGKIGVSPGKDIHLGIYRVLASSPPSTGTVPLLVERPIPPIAAYGSMRVEILVFAHHVPQIDPASLRVEYESISAIKKRYQKLYPSLQKVVWNLFSYGMRAYPEPTRHTAPLQDAALLHAPSVP